MTGVSDLICDRVLLAVKMPPNMVSENKNLKKENSAHQFSAFIVNTEFNWHGLKKHTNSPNMKAFTHLCRLHVFIAENHLSQASGVK
jgi:hypothetical protein